MNEKYDSYDYTFSEFTLSSYEEMWSDEELENIEGIRSLKFYYDIINTIGNEPIVIKDPDLRFQKTKRYKKEYERLVKLSSEQNISTNTIKLIASENYLTKLFNGRDSDLNYIYQVILYVDKNKTLIKISKEIKLYKYI